MQLVLASLIVIISHASAKEASDSWCRQVDISGHDHQMPFSQLYECPSVPPFFLSFFFSPVQLKLQCPSIRVSPSSQSQHG